MSGPSATAKPMSAKMAVSSSVTWLIGCTRPASTGASRTGSVTSTVSVLSLASSVAAPSASLAAAIAAVTRSFNPLKPPGKAPIMAPAGHAQTGDALPEPASSPVWEAGDTLSTLLHRAFGFSSFRPNQEAVCQAVADGKDVLLVMPTGSGKSLCYQLPGIARGGTTLVISPLIALMEDQVAKLKERGFAVARIHSGRERAASRQACIDYLNGKLQFLFIAPERLRVAGFPEMLAKR